MFLWAYKNIPSQTNSKYIDDFEIIAQEFAFFWENKFTCSFCLPKVVFSLIKNKILLEVIIEQSYIFEIVSINPESCNISFEKLI